jgi:glycosyltransferase involved in cell wall biosynthesis
LKSKKRVLLVNSQSLYENNSTSITLKSIISYFDTDSILEVYYYPINNYNDESLQINSIQLNRKTKLLYSIIAKFYKGKLKHGVNNKIVNKEIQSGVSKLNKLKKIILALNDYMKIRMKYNKKQIALIDEFKPDIIYTLGSSIFPLEISLYFSKRYSIPIVLHHMDNWRETAYIDSFLLKPCRNKLLKNINNVESVMECGMAISDEMAEYYSELSNNKYVSLMNTVPKLHINGQTKNEDEIHLVYAGGLHLNRWKALLEFEKVINKFNKEDKLVKLIIFTKQEDRQKYEHIFDKSLTKFYNYLPHNEVHRIYEMANILIHVESFDNELIKFTKYSLSTKIPEYMSSGRPIICYAPSELAVYKYIEKNTCGISVSSNEELYNGLELLLGNFELRKKMGENGKAVSAERHSIEYMNQVMKEVFDFEKEQVN